MKIKTITLTNYKAFRGKHQLRVSGKNLFIYGENGSGKSSLYYALKDFFQSSMEPIDLQVLENVFVPQQKKGKVGIDVVFMDDAGARKGIRKCHLNTDGRDYGDGTVIADANAFKSFLTYKHLLDIHHIRKGQQINLFDLLVKGVLTHFKLSFAGGQSLGEMWRELTAAMEKPTGRDFTTANKKQEVGQLTNRFNEVFGELFRQDSPEYILGHVAPFLEKFGLNLELNLTFAPLQANQEYTGFQQGSVGIDIVYAGHQVVQPHLFLNEARLSAIAISIYLGMIKRHPQGAPFKILFLDDIFIGLDISNRLPLLHILEEHFPAYQVFLTTYDKPWFEFAKAHLSNNWESLAFYAHRTRGGYDVPVIDQDNLLKKAKSHLEANDYKAAAVYARAHFEQQVRRYCSRKNKKVTFRENQKKYSSEDFWSVMKEDFSELVAEIETYRALVLNPFSHYNSQKHEIRSELDGAIQVLQKLDEAVLNKSKTGSHSRGN